MGAVGAILNVQFLEEPSLLPWTLMWATTLTLFSFTSSLALVKLIRDHDDGVVLKEAHRELGGGRYSVRR